MDRYEQQQYDMIVRMAKRGIDEDTIVELTGFSVDDVNECMNEFESVYYQEMNSFLDGIREEFFDNRIRVYELSKKGLIALAPYVRTEKLLEFYKKLKCDSMIIDLKV